LNKDLQMLSAIVLELLVILGLLVLNGIFAMSELAIVSARTARLKQASDEGSMGAQVALELTESPTRFLSTVQIGITLVGVLAGAFGGATLAEVLAEGLAEIALLEPYAHALGLGMVVVLISYLSLVIGELVPKRLAMQNPERVASLIARPMRRLAHVVGPVVALLTLSTNVVLRMLRVRDVTTPPVTEEEIRILLEQGTQAGVFEANEQHMVERVFQLDNRHVSALMTPRTEVMWLDVRATVAEIRETLMRTSYSCLPVCAGSLDRVIGTVHAKDLLRRCLRGAPPALTERLTPPSFVPENVIAARVIGLFKAHETHMLIVIDEYGGVQGIVTEHDLLEAFIGDIPSMGDAAEHRAVQRDDGSWLLDGLLHIDEVKAQLGITNLPEDNMGVYETLAGFMLNYFARIPQEGDTFEWGGWVFEVIDMDDHRIDKVLARLKAPESAGDAPQDT
jgi:putative hemolysin